jgi:hypothetical protein
VAEEREEALRGLCFCLIYDLCAWLAHAHRPVPVDVQEYRLDSARRLANPRDRLLLYVDRALLDHWDRALAPYFESGASLALELGEAAPLGAEGLDAPDRGVHAELRFSERSSLVDAADGRHPLPRRDWILEAWTSADLARVEDARLRPA